MWWNWKSSKPKPVQPPVQYHDGLIPTEGEDRVYPEVVLAEGHPPARNAKSYPEHMGRPIIPGAGPQTITPPDATHQAAYVPYEAADNPHIYNPAWGEQNGPYAPYEPPWYKRPITWVVLVALLIIAALAGILGAVATGAIETGSGSDSAPITQPPPTPTSSSTSADPTPTTTPSSTASTSTSATPSSVATPTCPAAANLNYTVEVPTTATSLREDKVFRIHCAGNYAGGDIKRESGVDSFRVCIEMCAYDDRCIAAVYRRLNNGVEGKDCWLKSRIGRVSFADNIETALLYQEF